jgi:hypothetical protein
MTIPSVGGPTTPSDPLRGGGDVIPAHPAVPSPTGAPTANAVPTTPTLPPNALLDLLSEPGLGTDLVVAGAIGLFVSVAGLFAVGWRRRQG